MERDDKQHLHARRGATTTHRAAVACHRKASAFVIELSQTWSCD